MSFFGFDTTLPKGAGRPGASRGIFEQRDPFAEVSQAHKLQAFRDTEDEPLEFDDTYDGLGDQLEETGDDFNDDTFGGGGGSGLEDAPSQGRVGKDFDFFGQTAKVSDVLGQEQLRYHLNHTSQRPSQDPTDPTAQKPRKTGYERYQDPGFIPDIAAKSSVWGTTVPQQSNAPPTTAPKPAPTAAKKMMSLAEVEAAMRAHSQPPPPMYQPAVSSYQAPFPQVDQHTMYPGQEFQRPPPVQSHPQQPQPQTQPQVQSQRESKAPHVPQILQRQQSSPAPKAQPTRAPQKPLQILQNPNRAPPVQPVDGQGPLSENLPGRAALPVITNPQQLMQLSDDQRKAYLEEDAKRAKRNHKIFLLSKGNGLMTPQDKNFITRIQLQQLVTATGTSNDSDPEANLLEDFYYQVYSQIRGAPRQHPTQPLGHFAQTYLFQTGSRTGGRRQQINGDNHMQRMQQQVQRAVEAAKLKPKNKQLIIEGSLGKISFSNAKTPKPLLNLKRAENSETSRPSSARKGLAEHKPTDRKTVLSNIEKAYGTLMQMEDHERQMPPPPNESDPGSISAHMEWRQTMQELNDKLWNELKVLEPIVPGSSVPHPFIAFLSHAKGKKAIPRIFRHVDQEQRVTILTMIVVHLDQLDVISRAQIAPGETQPPPMIREEVELFSQVVMPCLLGYVSEAPINIIMGLMGLVLDHTHVTEVSQTKVGLGILTMLLSRAELVKESGGVSDAEWQHWQSLYNRFFDILEPTMAGIFPGPVNAGDDMYVWQFLAAVGIGASPEQQQRLVIAVKDRVMETVAQSKTLPTEMSSQRLGNVNLFMRAIGLDVELLG